MNCILFDDPSLRQNLLPFTFTRPVAAIRTGIVQIFEKWQYFLSQPVSFMTEAYLQKKFPLLLASENLFCNGAVCPDEKLIQAIEKLPPDTRLVQNGLVLAVRTQDLSWQGSDFQEIEYKNELTVIRHLTDIFAYNGKQIRSDFAWLTVGRESQPITDPHTRVYGREQIFLEEGVQIWAAVINTETGPVYLGKNVIIQEGSLIRGSLAMLEGSHLNMGAKMRGDITIGPMSKVGGEVSNSVIFGYSNKAHEGYLGNSVLGEWCNLGADTNTSNMKNDYGNVRLWHYPSRDFVDCGRQFAGTFLGDHTKAGINTMFNTGTVAGVNCNIFGGGFPDRFIPSFSWGGGSVFERYEMEKALQVAARAMERRDVVFSGVDEEILRYLWDNRR
jgi:UDP-N-acetylglucosamine diphosphorylase/glucosamine-1-phosphate N-acetyltransferase